MQADCCKKPRFLCTEHRSTDKNLLKFALENYTEIETAYKDKAKAMQSFVILAIDGGGIRGIFAAKLLELIAAKYPLLSKVNLLAGTSTGAIIAACLSADMPPERITALYKAAGPSIFSRKFFLGPRLIEKALQSPYDIMRLQAILRQVFSKTKLCAAKKPLIIPTTDLKTGRAHIFKSYDCDPKLPLYKAVQASCSAPTYFDPSIVDGCLLADGGMWANNPSQVALGQALQHFGADYREVKIISIGTGHFNECYDENTRSWGLLNGWKIRTLTEFVSSLQSETAFEVLSTILPPGSLLRLNFSQNRLIKPDEFGEMEALEHKARLVFERNEFIIRQFIEKLDADDSSAPGSEQSAAQRQESLEAALSKVRTDY